MEGPLEGSIRPGRGQTKALELQPVLRPVKPGEDVRLGVVDMGSNAIRLLVAEFGSDGTRTPLASDRVPVRLGHAVFLTGRLTQHAMDAAVEALARFRERLDELKVHAYRAVATSAVRESANGEVFVQRVKHETGFQLDPISGAEEARLVHLAVGDRMALGDDPWMLVDLGGGSVEVALADKDGVLLTESHTIGSVRLLEELASDRLGPGGFQRLLDDYLSALRLPALARVRRPAGVAATGGNIETLAELAKAPTDDRGVARLPVDEIDQIVRTLSRLSFEERVEELGLRKDRADVILPAAMVYARLARLAEVEEVHVPHVGVKEGILLDLHDELTRGEAHGVRHVREVVAGARSLGRRYLFDEDHGAHVSSLALSLFDQLAHVHRLHERDREVLAAAAVLHDVGQFISYSKHHKHSYYILSQSELPGISPREVELVANVARYHRKADPDLKHDHYARLNSEERSRVTRMAAILRLADAMDRDHVQRVRAVDARVQGGKLHLEVRGRGELLLERWALERKGGLFSKAFQLSIGIEIGEVNEDG